MHLPEPSQDAKFRKFNKFHKITNMTLQYYNGVILPDTSAILAGILSKDLGNGSEHFFENFKILLHSKVYDECDSCPVRRGNGLPANVDPLPPLYPAEAGQV